MNSLKYLSNLGLDYIAEKQALGNKYQKNGQMMRRFLQLAQQNGYEGPVLERELVEQWCAKTAYETENNHQQRIGFIRGFAQYLTRLGYPAYIYERKSSVISYNYQPHIFTNRELAKLFRAAEALPDTKRYPFKSTQICLILKTLYSTGMRSSELAHLRKVDVNLTSGVLFISEAKFHKERYIPLNPTLHRKFREYTNYMCGFRCWNDSEYFFVNSAGKCHKDIYHPFRETLKLAGISHGGRGYGPRMHDLRHTFAVHCLRNWVRDGKDLTNALPYLAVYMGHSGIRSTQYYLRLTSELYPDITQTLDADYGWMVPEVGTYEDD
ncbi:MAG TPA: integrase [Eubacteriaceae bacterium]|nr:integrase [Eubacteriaceae bacterium]